MAHKRRKTPSEVSGGAFAFLAEWEGFEPYFFIGISRAERVGCVFSVNWKFWKMRGLLVESSGGKMGNNQGKISGKTGEKSVKKRPPFLPPLCLWLRF